MRELVIGAVCTMGCVAIGQAAGNADSAIVRDFEKRVSAYVNLRKDVESKLPPLKATVSPDKISHQEQELAAALRGVRGNVGEGNIFTPEIAGEMRRLIGLAMQPAGKEISTSLRHAEPVQLRLRVNDRYPANVPLQSTPPSLLMNLPPLPPQIEYRVTGRDLILLDTRANLVIDLIENVFVSAMTRRNLIWLALLACSSAAQDSPLPLKPGSVRFAVIGDNGTGGKGQYEVGRQMELYREKTGFDFVIMLGDNIYGGESAGGMKRKFEEPYQALLDAGVKFYASLGNHDNPNQRFYKPFNMDEKRYYHFRKGRVEFFALDSNYMDPKQLDWLQKELQNSDAPWKICFFHHPLYSDGKFHGPDVDLRGRLEPVFAADGVNVVFSGHEHVYERVVPKNGIHYFVLGNSGELRQHGLRPSPDVAKGFDTDRAFMVVEVDADRLYFQTITRTGATVDSGVIERQPTAKPGP